MSPSTASTQDLEHALSVVTPVDITNENFSRWGQVVRLPDADPNAVQVNQGKQKKKENPFFKPFTLS